MNDKRNQPHEEDAMNERPRPSQAEGEERGQRGSGNQPPKPSQAEGSREDVEETLEDQENKRK